MLLPRYARTLVLRSFLTLFGVAVFVAPALARTWHIKLDGTADFTRIQEAIDIAAYGDTVLVAPGTYNWTNQGPGEIRPEPHPPRAMLVMPNERPRGVTFLSEAGPEQTILDAEGEARVVFANGNNHPVELVEFTFKGFTLQGGVAVPAPPQVTTQGGAMALHLVYPLIEDCIFVDNSADEGGGVWAGGVSSIVFRNCQFLDNRAQIGGGAFLLNSHLLTVVEDCLFMGNEAIDGHMNWGLGGGLATFNFNFRLERSTFYDNTATVRGKALFVSNGKPGLITGNTFRNNPGGQTAVALAWSTGGDGASDVEFNNNLIAFNSPGAAVDVDPLVNESFACNDIYGNSGGNWSGSIDFWNGLLGNISLDPLFCATDGETWTVERNSPVLAQNSSCGEIGMSPNGGLSCGGLGLGDDDRDDPQPEAEVLAFRVHAAVPNPTSMGQGASVAYDLPRETFVDIGVYDLAGRKVATLRRAHETAGRHRVDWAGVDEAGQPVAAGVYLVRVQSERRTGLQRVVLLR